MEMMVEVISVGRATDVATGKFIYQIQFGHVIEVGEEMRRTMPQPTGAVAIKETASIVLSMFMNFPDAVPYKVGSKWRIILGDQGTLAMKAVNE
jgi:hypothetical protein